MTTPTPSQDTPPPAAQTPSGAPSIARAMGGAPTLTAAQQIARIQKSLNDQRAQMPGPLVRQTAPAARLAAILHNAAMDLWDVATEQDEGQMWEEARAITSRILAAAQQPSVAMTSHSI